MALNDHGVESSSSGSSSYRRYKYEVFLSFRGEDTRKKFTDHLYNALKSDGVMIAFRDEEELERGEAIKPSLHQAIEESLSAIVVLSENYATSTWCLDELVKITHSKKELGLRIFPVFYEVDPSDVRHQRGSFEEAFKKHEQKFAHDKICRWKDALKEVADLSGWNSLQYRYESELIEDVVKKVRSKLYGQPPFNSNDEGLVGIDEKIAEFDSFLAYSSEEVRFIGIWGMGGLGKTTLARAVYERIKENYDISFFVHNVREKSTTDIGLIELQKELLSHPNWRTEIKVGDCYKGRELIERRLCNRKVLLVLDDVSDMRQIENLAKKKGWFGKGSRIIITTRDQHLLSLHGEVSVYKMDRLTDQESLQLFLKKAFKEDQLEEYYLDYKELSNTVVKSADGLPLALTVFGSFLCGRKKPAWEDALKKIPSPTDIFKILKVSFDGLEKEEKMVFLDIACFFNGMAAKKVKQMLENLGLPAEIGIEVLINKSLVTEQEGCLWVHDTLQEMGKKIVSLESPNDDAGKCSRIWSLEDANHVLGKKRGTEVLRGIVVRFDQKYVIRMDPEAFLSMTNLKLLIISSHSHDQLNLPHGLTCISNTLKVIQWEWYPLEFLPSQTQLDELVDLKMQHSKLKELCRGTDQFLQNLKFIDLSHSTNLIKTPNFDKTPNLQRLILEGCTKLVEVHNSLGQHKNLVMVDLKGCKSIKTLPTKLDMNCLETLILSGCSKVKNLSEFGEGMEALSELDLEGTAISKLPQSLVNLSGLAILNVKDCKNLVCLPCGFQKLKAIKNINISGCSKFSRLPESLNENEALEELDVGGTAIKEVPESLDNLKVLSLSHCNGYDQSSSSWNHCSLPKQAFRLRRPSISTKFPCSPFPNLSSLVTLHLSYCNLDDESLSSEIGNLSSLTTLDLSGNNFVKFPSGLISKLRKLECIGLNNCPWLQSLPQLPSNLSIIQASDCPTLKNSVRSQELREFTEKFESQTRLRRSESSGLGWKSHFLSDYVSAIITWDSQFSDFFMQPTRLLTIPGNEVPSWFHNQSCFCAEDFPYEHTPTNVSFIVNIPDSCSSSEWWGIAVCLVLENDLESAKFGDADALCWSYRVSKASRYSKSFRGCAICVQSSCHHQLCIIYIRFTSFVEEKQKLQMVFFTHNKGEENKSVFRIGKCGWRVLCKEDVERWSKERDEECSSSNNDECIVEEDKPITEPCPSSDKSELRILRLCLNFLWPIVICFVFYVGLKSIISL